MKTYLIIGAIIIVAAVGGVLAFSGKTTNTDNQTPVQSGNNEQASSQASQTSMRALLASSKPQTCEFADETAAAKTNGTVYIANGRMRGDFNVIASNGQVSDGHMIMSDNTIHSWSSAYPMGVTMSFSAQSSAQGQTQAIDPDKKVDYRCEDWTPDESKFTPPSNVTFQDMSSFTIPGQAH